MMTCVRTVSFSVLINEQPHSNIIPTRGIRKRDPLSPYFFILCAEGLSTLLNNAKEEKGITGLAISKGGTRLNHLFFVDDSLLFCKANTLEWLRIQEVLKIYKKASSQGQDVLIFQLKHKGDKRSHYADCRGELNSKL